MTREAKFELWQDGIPVVTAAAVGAPIAQAAREILHYADVYEQDGPVEIKRVTRETMTRDQVLALVNNAFGPQEETSR